MAKARVKVRAKSVAPKAQAKQAMDMERMLTQGLPKPKPGGGAGKKPPPSKKKGY
jgi:hypothetical protein